MKFVAMKNYTLNMKTIISIMDMNVRLDYIAEVGLWRVTVSRCLTDSSCSACQRHVRGNAVTCYPKVNLDKS